jgi:putative ABC transport system ATP-binding protein
VTLLRAEGLTATLPGDTGDIKVLDGVGFELAAGEIVDVVGPSGSGKTTLLRALARLLPEAGGELSLDGVSAHDIVASVWRERVALLPQKPAIVDGTIAENLLLPWTLKVRQGQPGPDADALASAISSVDLDIALSRDASRLSVGQSARVALLRVLLTRPSVLLLDEPDAALDAVSAQSVAELIGQFAQAGGGVLRVRHHIADGLATRRLHLERGVLSPAVEAKS